MCKKWVAIFKVKVSIKWIWAHIIKIMTVMTCEKILLLLLQTEDVAWVTVNQIVAIRTSWYLKEEGNTGSNQENVERTLFL